ncbi:TadE/TadG family type IV pilus assembly protein [uncultured Friedmanniella sp.]|uniref:TadE/TadG family type IV pilus assembly protein n=1 Tax=uncultured Friedmanniella sp. TaxID=335381 RepID=UPI0035CA3194
MPLPSRDQRGLSESIQLAVVWPVLLLVTLGIIQAGIWLHARNVAERAAAAVVDVARGTDGSSGAAAELGEDLARAGGLTGVTVTVVRGPAQVSARVSGDAPLMLDLGLGKISETAAAPLERVTAP